MGGKTRKRGEFLRGRVSGESEALLEEREAWGGEE